MFASLAKLANAQVGVGQKGSPGLASWVFSVVPGGTCLGDLLYPGLKVLGYSRSSLRDLVLSFAPDLLAGG
jgi:hypothetical protein